MKFCDQERVSGQDNKKTTKTDQQSVSGQGDSGGPLTVVDSDERHTLVGLVSRKLFENQCNEVGVGVRKKVFLNYYFPFPVSTRDLHERGQPH